jgi:hypothetical protein
MPYNMHRKKVISKDTKTKAREKDLLVTHVTVGSEQGLDIKQ